MNNTLLWCSLFLNFTQLVNCVLRTVRNERVLRMLVIHALISPIKYLYNLYNICIIVEVGNMLVFTGYSMVLYEILANISICSYLLVIQWFAMG